MSRALRLSEKWFRRGLWLVSFVFASFLIGLGGTLVGDLPQVEKRVTLNDFIDRPAADAARQELRSSQESERAAREELQQAELRLKVAQADTTSARDSFSNWLATRRATERSEQDPEVIARTRALDGLRATERQALAAVQAQQQLVLDAQQNAERVSVRLADLESAASDRLQAAQRSQELRVFLYRLALTLPLLAVAGWLFAKHRRGTWWPFVWGFIFFAVFAFFVELVPYLPSYGGYVRHVVGIVVTVLVGRYAILALQRYLERQREAELLPDAQRREELSYDVALTRIAKSVCPGCERPVDLKDTKIDFCPHCGIGLHNHCGHCKTRKSAFSLFCHACGESAQAERPPSLATMP